MREVSQTGYDEIFASLTHRFTDSLTHGFRDEGGFTLKQVAYSGDHRRYCL